MSPIRYAISRSRPVLAALVLILISGLFAYKDIAKEAEPDVSLPIVTVSLIHTGISPEDAERLLLKPMEKELRGIEGIKELRAVAFDGGANLTIEFIAGYDIDVALSDVRNNVDIAKANLPEDTKEPMVNEVNLSLFPVISVSLGSDMPERTLLAIARDLKDTLETIPEVLEVKIAGDREEQVEIIIEPQLVDAYNISSSELSSFVSRSNRVVAAGALDTGQGRFNIKLPGLIENADELLDLPVKTSGDAVVKVRDIATVRRTFKDPTSFARLDDKKTLVIEVSKRIGTNIIDTVDKVRYAVAKSQEFWPPGINVTYLQDRSSDIRTKLDDLTNSVVTAILLVMIVVIAAMGFRTGLLVGVAIPGSFLMSLLALYAFGLTLNMVVMFGLILAVGMLVDGAIVVTEYADRKMAEGMDRKSAYARAGERMALPVIASTLTTLAAFLPLVFWTGVVGEFMKYLPITLLTTLTASLLMALVFVPTLGAWFGKPGAGNAEVMEALAGGEHGDVTKVPGFTGAYTRFLAKVLKRPGLVLIAAVVLLITAQGVYWTFGKGVEFFPSIEPQRAVLKVHARGNLSVWEMDSLIRQVERRVEGMDGVKAVYGRTGTGGRRDNKAEDQIGSVQVEFTNWRFRPTADQIITEIRHRTADLAGVDIQAQKQEGGPPVGKKVQVQLASREPSVLIPAVKRLRAAMDDMGGFVDVEDNRPMPGIQWEMQIDRAQAAKFGADISVVGDMVQLVTRGLKFSDFRPNDTTEVVDIVARYPEQYRSIDQLDRLRVATAAGMVPISNFVTREPQPQVGEIKRIDGLRVMTVQANVEPGILPDDKVTQIKQWLAEAGLDKRIQITFKGEDVEQEKSKAFLGKAFLIALFLMAIILIAQFNSFYSAFLILSAVIMSTMGVMMGLLAFHEPFGIIMSGIGVIALAGIVVNNNIVLIDTYDILKHEYSDPVEAVLHTCAQRLRPVMLTTITTILGLLPMMYSLNIDFLTRDITVGAPSMQMWSQLSTAIVSGLSFATVLTLVVTPSALIFKERLAARIRRRKPDTEDTENVTEQA